VLEQNSAIERQQIAGYEDRDRIAK
jgi:hypothetical protein